MINKKCYIEYAKQINEMQNDTKLIKDIVDKIKNEKWFKLIENRIDREIKDAIVKKVIYAVVEIPYNDFDDIKKHLSEKAKMIYLVDNDTSMIFYRKIICSYLGSAGIEYYDKYNKYLKPFKIAFEIPISQFQEEDE